MTNIKKKQKNFSWMAFKGLKMNNDFFEELFNFDIYSVEGKVIKG